MGQDTEQLRREIAQSRAELSGTLDAIGDRVSPNRIIERRKNRLANTAHSMRDRVLGTAHQAQDSLSERHEAAKEGVHDLPDRLKDRTEGAPMLAGALAFGVGFLVAAAVPPSRTEKDASKLLLSKAEPLKAQLNEAGHEIAEHLREPALEAVGQVKEAASGSAHQVADAVNKSGDDGRQSAGSSL
jgi:Protein of unknown function (DUF3618)